MNITRFLHLTFLLLGLLFLPFQAQAQYLEKLRTLRENLDLGGKKALAGDVGESRSRGELSSLQQIESYVSNDDYSSAVRTVKQAMARSDSPSTKKLWEALLADLEKEQLARQAALKKKVNDKLHSLSELALKAQKSEELDPLIDDLNDFQNEEIGRLSGPFGNRLRNQVSQAQNFLNRWQNYLDAIDSESSARRIEVLNDLINNRSSYRLVDKTRLVEIRKALLKAETDKAAALIGTLKPRIAAAKTADEIQAILDEVTELQNALPYNTAPRRTADRVINTLNSWLSVLQAEAAGNTQQVLGNLNNFENSGSAYQAGLISDEMIESKRNAALAKSSDSYSKKLQVIRPFIDAYLARAQKEGSLAPALDGLEQLQNNVQNNNRLRTQVGQLRNELERLIRMQQQLEGNRPTDFFNEARQALPEDNPWFSYSQSLREPLMLQGLDKFFKLKPVFKKGGNLSSNLSAMAANSARDGDWNQAVQLYKVLNMLNPGCLSGNWADKLKATNSYLEGMRLKEAGEKEAAISALLPVLYLDPEGIPRKETLAALKELRGK